MTPQPSPAYGTRLTLLVGGILAASVLALTTLLRVDPTLQVRVFGVAGGAGSPRAAAADIRAEGSAVAAGLLPGDLGLPFRLRPAGGHPWNGIIPQWTTLGLDPAASRLLGEARRLGAGGQWPQALALYDSVLARQPGNAAVATERARALSWSGDHAAAGEALALLALRTPGDGTLTLEAARNLYWAGKNDRADDLLSDAVAGAAAAAATEEPPAGSATAQPRAAPASAPRRVAPALLALRDSVRRAAAPSVERARRWVREHDGPRENLALARALVREHRPAAALAHYRVAVRGLADDSLQLELASAALEADSAGVAARALGAWLAAHPGDRAVALQRARALAWARDYPAAARAYAAVLAERDDPALRYELAEAQSWAGDTTGARASLAAVLRAEPRHARALRLQGDLARWSGQWAAAIASYEQAQAADPTLDGINPALAEAREGLRRDRAARRAGIPVGSARVDGFSDSEGFRWVGAEATRQWVQDDGSTVAVQAHTERVEGAGPGSDQGVGVALQAARTLRPGVRGSVSGGAAELGERLYPTASAGVRWSSEDASAGVRLVHEPGVRRAATLASLEAGVTSTRAEADASRQLGGVTVDGAATLERLAADPGSTSRVELSAGVSRALPRGVRLGVGAAALATSGPAPLRETRALYWSPRRYLQAQLTAALRRPLRRDLVLELRASPGLAWVDERQGLGRRFSASGMLPTLGAGGDLRYGSGAWAVVASADWARAGSGYHSTAARVYLTRALTLR